MSNLSEEIKNNINTEIIIIKDLLKRKYKNVLLDEDMVEMIRCEAKEMFGSYLRNVIKIENLEYIVYAKQENNSVLIEISYSQIYN